MTELWEFWLPFSIAFIGFLILLYDHFKDDRQLYKQIKEFYEGIECLILSYSSDLILKIRREATIDPERIETLKYNRIKKRIKHSYFQEFIRYNSKDCFKYLGLVYSGDNKRKIINKATNYVLGTEGHLGFKDLNGDPNKIPEIKVIQDLLNITSEQIKMIDEFLSSLREHWKEIHYAWLFRPELKKKIDYSEEFRKIYSF